MATKKGEIKQDKIRRKKSTGKIFDDLKTELGVKKLSKKLGIKPRTLHSYNSFFRFGTKQKKSDREPSKKIIFKLSEIAKKTKVKEYQQTTEKLKDGRLRGKKVFTGKYKRFSMTENVHKTYLKGTNLKILSSGTEKKIKQALKRKKFSYFFCRIHLEYYVNKVGIIQQWYAFPIKEKTLHKIEEHIQDFISMKKQMSSVMYFKILELNLDIIEK